MIYKILADSVVLIHFLWILFLLFGVFWGIRNKVVKIFHIFGLVSAFVIQIFDWYCPFTHLEIWLKSQYNPTLTYTGSFITHYVEKIVYIEISRTIVFVFTLFICGFNGWYYIKRSKKRSLYDLGR